MKWWKNLRQRYQALVFLLNMPALIVNAGTASSGSDDPEWIDGEHRLWKPGFLPVFRFLFINKITGNKTADNGTAFGRKLGKRFENMLGLWFDCKGIKYIYSLGLSVPKQAEADFVYVDEKLKCIYHLEVACKFMVLHGQFPEGSRFVGPQGRDSLAAKYHHMKNIQSRVFMQSSNRDALNMQWREKFQTDISGYQLKRQCLITGGLFVPGEWKNISVEDRKNALAEADSQLPLMDVGQMHECMAVDADWQPDENGLYCQKNAWLAPRLWQKIVKQADVDLPLLQSDGNNRLHYRKKSGRTNLVLVYRKFS